MVSLNQSETCKCKGLGSDSLLQVELFDQMYAGEPDDERRKRGSGLHRRGGYFDFQ